MKIEYDYDKPRVTSIPPKDSEQFLASLSSPETGESRQFREQLVGRLTRRLERTLMDTDHPTIGFSDMVYYGDPSIRFKLNPIDRNGLYILQKPTAFFRMLDERPQDFFVDCLNILPIMIITTMRDELIQRGYDQAKIDKKLKSMIFHGEHTELSLNGELLRPLAYGEDDPPLNDKRPFHAFSRRKITTSSVKFTDEAGLIPHSVTLGGDTEPGDLLFTTIFASRHRDDYGNADDQNGIILKKTIAGTPGDQIPVFAHRTHVDDRRSTIGGVVKMLGDEATKKKIPMEEFFVQGGIGLNVATFDYSGFYAKLAGCFRKKI